MKVPLQAWLRKAPPPQSAEAPSASESLSLAALPIWSRQTKAARAMMTQAMDALVMRFAGMSARLSQAADASHGQAGDDLVNTLSTTQTQLTTLLEDLRSALALRAQLLEEVMAVTQFMDQLQDMASGVSLIARQTNLLSVNAAIEAARAGEAGRGFSIVAKEVRHLSAESEATGKRITEVIGRVSSAMAKARTSYTAFTAHDQVFMAQAASTIGSVVNTMQQTASKVMQHNQNLVAEGQEVRQEIDQVLIAVQAQDRISQMLGHVHDDMDRLREWMGTAPHQRAHQSPPLWLDALQASYTTPEEHAAHHDQPYLSVVSHEPAQAPQQDTTFF